MINLKSEVSNSKYVTYGRIFVGVYRHTRSDVVLFRYMYVYNDGYSVVHMVHPGEDCKKAYKFIAHKLDTKRSYYQMLPYDDAMPYLKHFCSENHYNPKIFALANGQLGCKDESDRCPLEELCIKPGVKERPRVRRRYERRT